MVRLSRAGGMVRARTIFLALGLPLALAGVALLVLQGSEPRQVKAAMVGNVEAGRLVYEEHCSGCHGLKGDGDGPAATLLYPRPRDFRRGLYEVRITPSGALPTDEDLFRTISRGMPGSSMPPWGKALTEQQRWDLIAYIKTFSRRFAREEVPQPLVFGKAIPPSPQSVAKGRELYFGPLECFKCHGQEGRGDGPAALEQEDDFGYTILPANLTKSWDFRGGDTPADIVRTFITGLAGTPMPSYQDQMGEEEAWHLANFIRSLSPPRKPEVKALLRPKFVAGSLPASPDDPRWAQAEALFYPLVGQIMREPRNFTPSVDAITLRALQDGEELALMLAWDDRSENRRGKGDKTVDAVAVQFPVGVPQGFERPYFLEGDPRHPVNLWQWRADTGALVELNARGLGTAQPQEAEGQTLAGGALYQEGQWRVVVKRSLITQDAKNDIQFEAGRFIPVAFSAWDGQNGEEGKKRAVSTWYLLYLEPPPSSIRWLGVPMAVVVVGALEGLLLWWLGRQSAMEG